MKNARPKYRAQNAGAVVSLQFASDAILLGWAYNVSGRHWIHYLWLSWCQNLRCIRHLEVLIFSVTTGTPAVYSKSDVTLR
jgi:hypothetical protein